VRESDIQRQILDYFSAMRIPALRVNSGRIWAGRNRCLKFGDVGFPDLLVWPGKGVTLAVEVKRPGEPLTPAQIDWAHKLRDKGIQYLVARSVEEVAARINALREAA
jgi:hypothetical protein